MILGGNGRFADPFQVHEFHVALLKLGGEPWLSSNLKSPRQPRVTRSIRVTATKPSLLVPTAFYRPIVIFAVE